MNYITNNQNTSRQQLSAPTRAGWGTCALLCMLLVVFAAPARAGTNDFTENFGNKLTLNIGTSGTTVTITSAGTSYTASLSAGTWNGTDNANVSGNGTATLTVSSAGVSAYNVGGIFVTDTGGTGNIVAFGMSTGAYNSQLSVTLGDAGDSMQVNGTTSFAVNLGMVAQSAGTFSIGGVSLTATGSGSFEFTTAGAFTVNTGAVISASSVNLLADTLNNLFGDDGVGTLSINGTASITGGSIQLTGADIDISTTATVGDSSTMGIFISSSLETRPISLGGTNSQVAGINLTNAELARLTVSTSNGNIQIGTNFGMPTGQSGDITCTTASVPLPSGTSITLSQDPSAGGTIFVNSGGTALDVGLASLSFLIGTGGLVPSQNPTDISVKSNGLNLVMGPLNISSTTVQPTNGEVITILKNIGTATTGSFSNVAQGGTVMLTYNSMPYPFTADYNYTGNGGSDVVLTYVPSSPPPIVTTAAADSITAISATLHGTVDPNGTQTMVEFEFGPDTSYGMLVGGMPSPIAGTAGVTSVSANLTDISPGTLYHFRIKAINAGGPSLGNDMTFTTLSADANLSDLTISTTTLDKPFVGDTLTYTASTYASSVTVTPTADQVAATIKVNGQSVISGQASQSIPLSLGSNVITIDVTAEDIVDTNSYTITVTRIAQIASTTLATSTSALYSTAAQNLTLSATVTSSGTVNDGTVTFQLNDGVNNVGSPVQTGPVTNGNASVTYALPAGSPAAKYKIFATFSNSFMYADSSDSTQNVSVLANTSTTTATSVFAPFNSASYNVTLDAIVTSPSGAVNEGTLTFQLLDSGNNLIGASTKSPTVVNGAAEVTYTVPAGTITGTYKISATYSGTANISGSIDTTHSVTVAVDMPPTITDFETSDNPALLNAPVTYLFSATDPDTATLSYAFDFGDGTQPVQGSFAQGTNVSVSHTYTSYTVGVPITLTVTDGFNPVTATDTLVIPMPNSGASNVPNVNQGQPPIVSPPTTPLGGISVQVQSSDAGVIQLNIDVNSLTRDAYSVSTDWGDISGRSAKVPGTKPVHVYNNRGIFVAKTTATNKSTNAVAGKSRITLPLSSKETGDFTTNTPNATPGVRTQVTSNTSITTKSLKGKFNFSGSKTDTVTYSGSIQLPAGITIGQPHEFWIGIGNIIVTTTLDKNGKGSVPGSPGILKSLKVTSKLKKGQTSVGGEPATVTCTYSTMAMVANGFDTEGISKDSTDLPKGKSTSRMIQVAMLLDGSPFQSLAPVNFSKSRNSDLGTISGRSSKP